MDVFEGYSFNDRHSIVMVEGAPGKEISEGARRDGEFNSEKALESNDLTEQTILITEAYSRPRLR